MASNKRIGPIDVIIDAIDECEESNRGRLLQSVLERGALSQSGVDFNLSHVKFLITIRPQTSRLCPSHNVSILTIDPSNGSAEDDLRLVIQARIAGIVHRTHSKPEARIYLETALLSKADRTFLWVTLVLHLLEESYLVSQQDFERIVDELPQDLNAAYERILQVIAPEDQEYASRLLNFIVGSSRRLTIEEMRVLSALDSQTTLAAVENNMQPNTQEIIERVLGPLVRIWNSRIYLVHLSLKEYLLSLAGQPQNPLAACFGVQSARSSLMVAEACICYLLLDNFSKDIFSLDAVDLELSPVSLSEDGKSLEYLWYPFHIGDESRETMFIDPEILDAEACARIKVRYSFFGYAAKYWPPQFASGHKLASPELKAAVLLLSDTRGFPGVNWFRYYWSCSAVHLPCRKDFDALVTASYFGHQDTVDYLLSMLASPEMNISQVRGLFWAACSGHANIVDKFLKAGVSPDVKVAEGATCLIAVSQSNHGEVVRLLLESEGLLSNEAGFRVNYAWHRGRTPLSIAAENGFLRIVRQLLHHEHVQPEFADFNQWTPLLYSVFGKHLYVLQALLSDRRVSPNHMDRTGRNALSWAASEGHVDIVKYLLSLYHMRVDERDQAGRTALSWAAGSGHLKVVIELRRSRRIDVSSRDNDGLNALSWACHGRHDKVVEYLIKYDRSGVDAADVDGWTPLAWALFRNSLKTVQALLASGLADVNKKDQNGRCPLSFATGYGYLDVVKLLLSVEGIDVNSASHAGQTPLSAARANGHTDVADELLKVLEE